MQPMRQKQLKAVLICSGLHEAWFALLATGSPANRFSYYVTILFMSPVRP